MVTTGDEGPAILQLHTWAPAEVTVDPLEFREAFISPSRQLLLLLSYQCEALLLPLVRGDWSRKSESDHKENFQDAEQLAISLEAVTAPINSDLEDDAPCTSGSSMELNCDSARSHSYSYIYGVNSLAWGLCTDTYNQRKDSPFREFLFVSGPHGLQVHAFCWPRKTKRKMPPHQDKFGQGRWVEWGPDVAGGRGNLMDETTINGTGENMGDICEETNPDELYRDSSCKKWLRSFFTEAKHVKSEGYFWTNFPENSSFPCSAEVVSFSLFDTNLPFLDFLLNRNSSNLDSNYLAASVDPISDASMKVNSRLFRCTKVFSSNSHHLIGFVLTWTDCGFENTGDVCKEKKNSNLVVVSRIHGFGMQWVSLIKLEGNMTMDPAVRWMDFCFSEDLVACLNSCGLIFFYSIVSGTYVSKINIVETCGLSCHIKLDEQEIASVDADQQQLEKSPDKSACPSDSFCCKRVFKRLLVASNTSLLAALDNTNVVYVISARDFVPEQYYLSEKLLPHFQHSDLGRFAVWVVGGSEVGQQKEYSNLSGSYISKLSSLRNGIFPFSDRTKFNDFEEIQHQDYNMGCLFDMNYCGFSVSSEKKRRICRSISLKQFKRKVFLPTDRSAEDDCICFSPVGLTRLTKRYETKDRKSSRVVHLNLHSDSVFCDDRCLNYECKIFCHQGMKEAYVEEAVGCTFEGFFYLVTRKGLSVVLPSVSVSSNFLPVEFIGYRHPWIYEDRKCQAQCSLDIKESNMPWSPWKVEILDRVLLCEGPEVADRLSLENGWDLKISRVRRLQLALEFLKFDEIQQSLERLVDVNLAEEGILRLIFAIVYIMFCKAGNDNVASLASRLLLLGTHFSTKMIRQYGLLQHKKDKYISQACGRSQILALPSASPVKVDEEVDYCTRVQEMAQYLEIIRHLQLQLSTRIKKPGQMDRDKSLSLEKTDPMQEESRLSVVAADPVVLETLEQQEISVPDALESNSEKFALIPMKSLPTKNRIDVKDTFDESALVPQEGVFRSLLPVENPIEMISRWKVSNLDLKTVVKDALLAGRLPLAVLQLHLHRSKEQDAQDIFNQVRDVGRAIVYDLFLKGDTGLAVSTLQRLGEDIEISLKQLLFGTVRKSLRMQIAEQMRKHGYLGAHEWETLEKLSLIERLYPSSSFWKTFVGQQKELMQVQLTSTSPEDYKLCMLHLDLFGNLDIKCGEIDGVVLGPWATFNEDDSMPVGDDDNAVAGYWAAAAVWSNAWDRRTVDRIVFDRPFVMGVHVPWESQLEYQMSHNNWEEVCKLLNLIPASVLSDGSLQISLDYLQPVSSVGCGTDYSADGKYLCSIEELDAVCMDVPEIKLFRFLASNMCTMWLRMHLEKELAKKFIFLKEFWEGTLEIVTLLACSGFITSKYHIPCQDESDDTSGNMQFLNDGAASQEDTLEALHKVLVHHCATYNLPYLLDLYLDAHDLVLDNDSLCSLKAAAGHCQRTRWLLLSRIKGCEYDASFSNARSIMFRNSVSGSKLRVIDTDELILTVDDIAEGGGELAALATLMYAPLPIQNCLNSGSVHRTGRSSAQCTLENLKPALQQFPTLWRTLVAACFAQDSTGNLLGPRAKNAFAGSALSDYLNWRDNVFFSSGRDTSLLQMLPCWFPKAVRRLIQLFIQGPLGWHSLSGLPVGESLMNRDIEFYFNVDEHSEVSAVSWEATIQKHVEEELYDSSLVESELGLEHHLHRGRAMAAFNHIFGARVQKLKSEKPYGTSTQGQTSVQSDVQALLAPLTPTEESFLSSVMPLAIMHFEVPVIVASCAFLLELCGLSASTLRVDVAAFKRISAFYKSLEDTESRQLSPKGSAVHASARGGSIVESLARVLADKYLQDNRSVSKGRESLVADKYPSRALMLVLQHLEKASLPRPVDGKTCGYWLMSGDGDGNELRSQQKATSQHWNLVTAFCQMHQLPLSTKYLAFLARDNDWVGFLTEAQLGGYSLEAVVEVASKEFSDPRLKVHVTTVLKGMQSRKKSNSSSYLEPVGKRSGTSFADDTVHIPSELFVILADCEKQKFPGKSLLMKAKELSWSLLAVVASCFSDVTPLACLTVWLEITAARETSSIKVNDIASQIANNVGAAVKTTNSLPVGSRSLTFHYNRQNPKRRRLMEPMLAESVSTKSYMSCNSASTSRLITQIAEEGGNIEDGEVISVSCDSDEGPDFLSKMVAVLCKQRLFLPLLRAFEMFLPSCSLLPFIRALQAFSQMCLSEASAHLGSFSSRIKEEPGQMQAGTGEGEIGALWIRSTAVKAADLMLSTCPSPYEKRCLLHLLATTEFGDGGSTAGYYQRLHWKINLAEPLLRRDDDLQLGNETLDDASLLSELEKNGYWEQARNWARQLEASGGTWKCAVHHVTETQAESMVAEWKEFLWDVPEERVALWSHCQTLFLRHSFPPLQVGLFFLRHAETVEKDLPAKELHELLLLALQWLSGMITLSNPVYPLHLLREIETRAWLLAVESEAQLKSEREFNTTSSTNSSGIIDRTASIVTKMDNHIIRMRNRIIEKHDGRDYNKIQGSDMNLSNIAGGLSKARRRGKGLVASRRHQVDTIDKIADAEDGFTPFGARNDLQSQNENFKVGFSFSRWEERVGPAEMERAVLSLLEFGQITAAKQLQQKLSPAHAPSEFMLIDTALKLASFATPRSEVRLSMLDEEVQSVIQINTRLSDQRTVDPLEVLESMVTVFTEGSGRGLCKRIIALVKAANILGISFSEAFDKKPIEVLQLLSLKAQESFEEAKLLVQTHSMPASSIAQVLSESFLKGLLAAHRGGYMDSQKEEGPAPLLWRFSDFLKWAELCSSEPEIGHSLMRLVITGQEIPHACEVELLILSHHFYKSSACLDGVDVLVALAANRVETYVSEGDFACLARLITGVGNLQALNFILGILIENGQLDIILQKYSTAAEEDAQTAEDAKGFRMSVLTSLKHFNPNDLDAFAKVYNHFDMKHEAAALLESRAERSSQLWLHRYDKDQNEDLLDSMRYFIEAAEVYSSLDAGDNTRRACAQASLVSLQIRMPDIQWIHLSETNARRALVEQSRFQEALIVAEAYSLNQPSEWALVIWNQMLKPELTEEFVAEFVAVLPLQPSMLMELAKFYRAEVVARGDQSQFSVWLTGGGLPAEWAKYLGRSFRCLLKRTRDLRFRLEMARIATGFTDIVDACTKALDRVPENAGPLVLRKGHGGAYLPLM